MLRSEPKRYQGIVNWFHPEKGFGFITVPEISEDVFVHFAQIDMEGYRSLKAGQNVTFEIIEGAKGKHAKQVRLS